MLSKVWIYEIQYIQVESNLVPNVLLNKIFYDFLRYENWTKHYIDLIWIFMLIKSDDDKQSNKVVNLLR